jgi:hypothetical protein
VLRPLLPAVPNRADEAAGNAVARGGGEKDCYLGGAGEAPPLSFWERACA